jgi:[ribosomal protein S5]-alanine N-acetyltransferase
MMRALEHPLVTPRLRLEPVTPRLAAAARQGGAMFAEELGAAAPQEWCASGLTLVGRSAQWGSPMPPTRAVAVHHDEGCVIGDVRFEPVFGATREVEIGYSIARSRRRQGYAVEAAGVVIDWLFSEGGAKTIVAGCDARNRASVRTLRRLGFWLDSTPGSAFWWVLTRDLRLSSRA